MLLLLLLLAPCLCLLASVLYLVYLECVAYTPFVPASKRKRGLGHRKWSAKEQAESGLLFDSLQLPPLRVDWFDTLLVHLPQLIILFSHHPT
jgi:hypothetical protein